MCPRVYIDFVVWIIKVYQSKLIKQEDLHNSLNSDYEIIKKNQFWLINNV